MKSFFATAIIAALATAGEWNMVCADNGDCYWVETADVRGDFEDAIEEIGRALEDLQNADIGEMERDMESEIEREIKRTMEDLECWWADRNNGNGECAYRTRRAEEDACWQTEGMVWDWDSQQCMTWEARRALEAVRCVEEEGGEWMELGEGWGEECYTGEPWQDCTMQGEDFVFDWENQECVSAQVWCERDENQTWVTEDWGSHCSWNGLLMKRLAPKQRMILAAYSAEFNLPALEKIAEPVQAGEEEGAELFEGFADDMESTIESWAPLLEQWQSEQEAREEAAFMELANTVVDSVTVDGQSLRDIYGSPENWFMARNPRNAKSIRSVVLQEGGENVKLSFEGPSEEEFNLWLESIGEAAGAIADQLETIGNDYKTKSDELNRQTGDALEPVGGDVEDLVNWIGDDVKALTESVMEGVSFSLASKKPVQAAKKPVQAATKSNAGFNWSLATKNQPVQAATKSNAGYYAGASAGFVGVLAVAAVVAACNKKKTIHSTEESLL